MLRYIIALLALFPAFALANGHDETADSSASQRPNIIYIMSDDHASEAISAYSHLAPHLKDVVSTPNIDTLAKEGVRFDNVYCNFSLCSPSRASIMTGQYSHRTGVRRLFAAIAPECEWVSSALQKAGYSTALIGKWHLQNTPQGFDHYEIVHDQGAYFNPKFKSETDVKQYQGYATDVYTGRALEWLKSQEKTGKPYCLMLHFKAPHYPFDYAPRYEHMFDGVTIPEPDNLFEDRSISPLLKTPTPTIVSLYYPLHKHQFKTSPKDSYEQKTRDAYQFMMKNYLRCVRGIDDNIGRILKYLDETGQANNTVVIYCADQGYWLGQHGLYDKRIILDESIRMPFVVRWPGHIKPGSVCKNLVSNTDFAPTLLDIAQSKTAKEDMPNMQGVSILPLLEGKQPKQWRSRLFYCYTAQPPHWGLRTDRYTLACFPGTDEVELYDNLTDPKQNVNVAKDPKYAEVVKQLKAELEEEMKAIDLAPDQLPGGAREYRDNSGGTVAPL